MKKNICLIILLFVWLTSKGQLTLTTAEIYNLSSLSVFNFDNYYELVQIEQYDEFGEVISTETKHYQITFKFDDMNGMGIAKAENAIAIPLCVEQFDEFGENFCNGGYYAVYIKQSEDNFQFLYIEAPDGYFFDEIENESKLVLNKIHSHFDGYNYQIITEPIHFKYPFPNFEKENIQKSYLNFLNKLNTNPTSVNYFKDSSLCEFGVGDVYLDVLSVSFNNIDVSDDNNSFQVKTSLKSSGSCFTEDDEFTVNYQVIRKFPRFIFQIDSIIPPDGYTWKNGEKYKRYLVKNK